MKRNAIDFEMTAHQHSQTIVNSNTILALAVATLARSLPTSGSSLDQPFIESRSTTGASVLSTNDGLMVPKSAMNAFVEIEGHTIGDEHRSETSSNQFFNSIDKDRDGKLGQSELSQFLKDHIGGQTLDTDDEAEMEAEAIMDRLDHNKDDELDSKDVFRYWKSLESLLTVDEVAEWVVHSVQLPHEIGE